LADILYNNTTGLPEQVNDSQNALAAGTHEIPLVSPTGEIGSASQEDAQNLLAIGYTQPNPEQLKGLQHTARFTSTPEKIKAGVEALGSGLAGPLMTGAERSIGIPAEEITGRQEENKRIRIGGQAVGLGAGVLFGSGLASIMEHVGEAGVKKLGFEAVEHAAELTAKAAAATKAGLPQAAQLAEAARAANAAISPVARVGSATAQAAIENMVFESGNQVEHKFLNDPNQTFGRVAAEIGISGVLGGLIGGGLKGTQELWALGPGKQLAQTLQSVKNKANGLPEELMTATDMNIGPEIRAALGDDPKARDIAAQMMHSDTKSAKRFQQAYEDFKNQLADKTLDTLGHTAESASDIKNMSKAEIGQQMQDQLAKSLEEKVLPISQKYEEFENQFKSAPIPPIVRNDMLNKINQAIVDQGLLKGQNDSALKVAQDVIKNLDKQANAQDLRSYIQNLRTAHPFGSDTYQIGKALRNILDDGQSSTLESAAASASEGLAQTAKATNPLANKQVQEVADKYAAEHGLQLNHNMPPAEVNVDRAKKIAQAYDEMKHEPNNPEVKQAYDALIKEASDQFQEVKKTGLKIEAIPHNAENPYKHSSDLLKDVKENNHMWYFPTEEGFGSGAAKFSDHPLLKPSGEVINGKELANNDIFRIVHDYFGHVKQGLQFGPKGEENAWRAHMQMFSPEAQKALTTETRGQNSWVNFGPHGAANRAHPEKTIYADQKAGLLPEWAQSTSNLTKNSIKEPHAILSVENPRFPTNGKITTRDAINKLQAAGEDATLAKGKYGAEENSIIIAHPKNPALIEQMAKDSGQESYLVSANGKHEMRYVNGEYAGKANFGTGTAIHPKAPEDFYTTMRDEAGNEIHFSHNIDFNKFGNASELPAAPESLYQKFKQTQADYAAHKNVLAELNDRLHLGREAKYGTGSFINALKSENPEVVLNRLKLKDDTNLQKILADKFPEMNDLARKQELDSIIRKSLNKNGDHISMDKLMKNMDTAGADLRNNILSTDQQNKLSQFFDLHKKVIQNINPSGTAKTINKLWGHMTSSTMAMASMLTGHNPMLGGLLGATANFLGKEVPDAVRMSYLKFLGSNMPVSATGFQAMTKMAKNTIRGEAKISKSSKAIFEGVHHVVEPGPEDLKELSDKIAKVIDAPEKLLELSGDLGHYMPETASIVSLATQRQLNYLTALKPITTPLAPLDAKRVASNEDKAKYNNALKIAQEPVLLLKYIKDGSLTMQDMQDIQNLHPELLSIMREKVTHDMMDHLSKDKTIPYKTKMSLSVFLGQPLDSSMQPQAIMSAQPQMTQPQAQSMPASKGKNLTKLPNSYMTPDQSRQVNKTNAH
jgi:hypothetical protein